MPLPSTRTVFAKAFKYPLALTFTLYFVISFSIQLLEIPLLRLVENAVCTRHFRFMNGSPQDLVSLEIDEAVCKISIVQSQLAKTIGWKISFDALPGLLTSIYYSSVADSHGRYIVLVLSIIGTTLAILWTVVICAFNSIFPIQVVWVSSLFLFLGGGTRVFNSMIFTVVADSSSDHNRTKYLYLLAAGPHINRLLAPRVSAFFMLYSLYLPFWIAIFLNVASMMFATLLHWRERLDQHAYSRVASSDSESTTDDGSINRDIASDLTPLINPLPADSSLDVSKIDQSTTRGLLQNIATLYRSPAVQFCLTAFFLKRLAFASEGFIFQFASEKFLWDLRQTTWLRVSAALGAICATLFVCPLLTSAFTKRGFDVHHLDLNIVRASLFIATLSFFLVWKAPSGSFLVIAMIGAGTAEGLEPALQGLATFLTGSTQNAQLFAVIAICDTVAELAGGPITAGLMEIGRSENHPSNGVCFLVSSIIFGILGIWACLIKARN